MEKRAKIVWSVVSVVVAAVIVAGVVMLSSGSDWATARTGDEVYTFRVADNAFERASGLSGMSIGELDADGMLFVFPTDEERTFTMRGMQFDLDIMWIRDGKILDIDYGVPAPQAGQEPITISSKPLLVDMVIEVPAGRAIEMNFFPGHTVVVDLDAEAGN